jgi:hypothetical protein
MPPTMAPVLFAGAGAAVVGAAVVGAPVVELGETAAACSGECATERSAPELGL